MSSSLVSFEALQVGVLARQIHEDPSVVRMFPAAEETDRPPYTTKLFRLAIEAALLHELDERNVVEDIRPLEGPFDSLEDLSTKFGERYNDSLWLKFYALERQTIRPVRRFFRPTLVWKPVFEWVSESDNISLDAAYSRVHGNLRGIDGIPSTLEGAVIGLKKKHPEADGLEIAQRLRKATPVPRAAANIVTAASEALQANIRAGDPHNVLVERGGRLRVQGPIGACPISGGGSPNEEPWMATVDEIQQARAAEGDVGIGCPVFAYSKIAENVWGRLVDEALPRGLLGHL
jgi:hypothetical protein